MSETNITAAPETEKSYFDGNVIEWVGLSIVAPIIFLFTLGFGMPWALCMIYKWKYSHTLIEGRRLQFTGTGGSLFWNWIKWQLLCIITLGIYGFWLVVALQKWKVKNISFAK